jgi:hypothetical protein
VARGHRPGHRVPGAGRREGLRRALRAAAGAAAGGGGALRRAAGGALLHEELVAQALHRRQQRQRDQQPPRGDRRDRRRLPRRPPGDDGRLRVRDGRHQDPRGIPQRPHGRGRRDRDRAGDPAPDESRQHLPPHQDAGPAALRVLQQERRDPGHGPAPGDRLGHPDRRDEARRPAHQPLRLRRRLRDGAQPLPDAGRDRPPADRPRDRRPDAGVHPHPGHRAMYPASASASSTR